MTEQSSPTTTAEVLDQAANVIADLAGTRPPGPFRDGLRAAQRTVLGLAAAASARAESGRETPIEDDEYVRPTLDAYAVAELLSCSHMTVRRMEANKMIVGHWIGASLHGRQRLLFSRKAVDDYLRTTVRR